MSEVTEAIQGLTQYLFTENQRLDKVDKEKRVGLAAENIATKFRELSPNASLQEIQALQFELIEDAAAIGGLQENMPLIAGAYQSVLNIRQLERDEHQDKVLADIISTKFNIDTKGISSDQAIDLIQLEKSTERSLDARGPEGKNFNIVFDALGKETFRFEIDAVGFKEETDLFESRARFSADLNLAGQKELVRFKAKEKGSSGMKFLQNKKGSKGELLYEGSDGRLYTMNRSGEFLRYAGGRNSVIDVKGLGAETKDVLGTIEATEDIFGPEQYFLLSGVFEGKKGEKLIEELAGTTDIRKFDKDAHKQVLTSGAIKRVEAFFSQPKDKIDDILYGKRNARGELIDKDEPGLLDELEIDEVSIKLLDDFRLAFVTKRALVGQQLDLLPETIYDRITSPLEWDKGVNTLEFLLTNPGVPDSISAKVRKFLQQNIPLADSSAIGMEHFPLLDFGLQKILIKEAAKYTGVTR